MRKIRRFNVNLYLEPPVEVEHRHDILEAAKNRLELYQTFGNCACGLQTPSPELKNLYFGRLLASNCPQIVRRDDEISHWILRLAYSTSPKLMRYFVHCEIDWFKLRWSCMDDQDEFWKTIVLPTCQNDTYQVPYQECPSILRKRNCIVRGGVAYFEKEHLIDWLLDQFAKNLQEALSYASKFISSKQDKRLEQMLEDLRPFLNNSSRGDIDRDEHLLERLPEKSNEFPLCMKILYDTLTRDKHLKYFGRLQLGLFLKGLGLSLNDALQFWRGEFLQRISRARFQKYDYKFRHMYGEVGSMLDYDPYSCGSIQAVTEGDDKPHGCPFMKSEAYLSQFLESNHNKSAILEMKRNEQWNEACGEYFRGVKSFEIEVSHPNQYYTCSLNCSAATNLVDIEDIFVGVDDD